VTREPLLASYMKGKRKLQYISKNTYIDSIFYIYLISKSYRENFCSFLHRFDLKPLLSLLQSFDRIRADMSNSCEVCKVDFLTFRLYEI